MNEHKIKRKIRRRKRLFGPKEPIKPRIGKVFVTYEIASDEN